MKIYSDVLLLPDLILTVSQVPGLYIEEINRIEKPKVRSKGWTLRTASTTGTRWRNNGVRGADGLKAGTRDDHGNWFRLLYAIDPNAHICQYKNEADFHEKTFGRYRSTIAD